MSKPTLIAMVGLPRSGKSTIVKELAQVVQAPIVRRDAIRLALHGQRYQSEAEGMIRALDRIFIKSLFLAGHNTVICDETNYSRAARNHMRDESWDTIFYPVMTSKEVCQERAIATGQPDLVKVIEEMAARWEPLEPTDTVWEPV